MQWLFFMIFAYLLGSMPTGVVVSHLLRRTDPRRAGSGNIGATNVARILGWRAGTVTLGGDVLKGFVPVAWAAAALTSPWAVAGVALAAYLGHLFPIYLGFRGGKGVATGLGVFLGLSPGTVLWAALVFGLVRMRWGVVSLASLAGAATLPLAAAFRQQHLAFVTLALALAGFTLERHADNIERLLDGTEANDGAAY